MQVDAYTIDNRTEKGHIDRVDWVGLHKIRIEHISLD